ncbi:hypothetical protein Zmor_008898 [Zophobas morio]|uniref:DNA mismatch repair proteins mutS family domain-containing protein n=1 Tax=Zophobas morio TaxID=2755281 RepID=A0AA38LZ38_9CUCU|nr:hypothetical protein Zmor_008898 [Zophobas morio]
MKTFPSVQECAVVYFPQLELDENLGDIHSDITDLENGILWRLKEAALSQFTVMMNISKVAAEIDWYCNLFYVSFIKSFEEKSFQALAAVALELGYDCAPVFHFSNRLIIRNGRHPLQELCVEQFIPNDSVFEAKNSRIQIFTGPNASGKSIYLKQVDLLRSLIYIKDQKIHSRESVAVDKSTFMIDLNQVGMALRNATEKSLVIIDEFGKGTFSPEGLGLLRATLEFWSSSSPRVVGYF